MSRNICFAIILLSWTVRSSAQWAQIAFRVIDDNANVVSGASVSVSTPMPTRTLSGFEYEGENKQYDKMTDTNGAVIFNIPCELGRISYGVSGERNPPNSFYQMLIAGIPYYCDRGGKIQFKNVIDNVWQPRNKAVEIIVRNIINPIPMYAKNLVSAETLFPEYNQSICYDMERGDWLPPYGNGQVADFVYRMDCVLAPIGADQIQYYDATMMLTFTNEDDGILEYPDSQSNLEGSVFHLPRYAPEDGYVNHWELKKYRHVDGSSLTASPKNEKMNYFIRVRTQKDKDGKITSALYGKIRGPIWYGITARGAGLDMCYYLNPTPNDRNMEFDPKRNLFTDLAPLEQVRDP